MNVELCLFYTSPIKSAITASHGCLLDPSSVTSGGATARPRSSGRIRRPTSAAASPTASAAPQGALHTNLLMRTASDSCNDLAGALGGLALQLPHQEEQQQQEQQQSVLTSRSEYQAPFPYSIATSSGTVAVQNVDMSDIQLAGVANVGVSSSGRVVRPSSSTGIIARTTSKSYLSSLGAGLGAGIVQNNKASSSITRPVSSSRRLSGSGPSGGQLQGVVLAATEGRGSNVLDFDPPEQLIVQRRRPSTGSVSFGIAGIGTGTGGIATGAVGGSRKATATRALFHKVGVASLASKVVDNTNHKYV